MPRDWCLADRAAGAGRLRRAASRIRRPRRDRPRWRTRIQPSFVPQAVRPARGGGSSTTRCSTGWRRAALQRESRRPGRRRARRAGARDLRRCEAGSVSDSGRRRVDRSPGAGRSRIHRRADSRPRRIAPASMRSGKSTCSAASGRRCAQRRRRRERFEATLEDVRVSVAAEVARNYFELRGLQQQLAVAERSLTNQRETLRLTQVRRDAALAKSTTWPARRRASRRSKRACRRFVPRRSPRVEHRLAVLTGVRPGELTVDLAPRPYPPLAKALPLGDPAQLLRRRPDVRAAERRLAAATAREGVARAELFPRITHRRLPGPARGPRQHVRDVRFARLGGDAGSELGGVRSRQRPRAAARREAGTRRSPRRLRADGAARARGNRERAGRVSRAAAAPREAGRPGAREHTRRGASRARAIAKASPTSSRCSTPSARSSRPKTPSRRPKPSNFTAVVAVYKAFGGIIQ